MYGLALWQLHCIINHHISFGVVSYIDVLPAYDPGDRQLRQGSNLLNPLEDGVLH